MKYQRFLHFLLVVFMLAAFFTPQSAQASPLAPLKTVAKGSTVANLTVYNYTGGTMYIRLQGPNYYFFSTNRRGRVRFQGITPGTYTVTITSSACSGEVVLKNKVFKKEFRAKPIGCGRKK